MSVAVRFAPSPTGYLHIGNARTALFNGLFARKRAGRFVLRFDDTDRERSKPEYERAVVEDLGWLGLAPDLVLRQSDRLPLYEAAAGRLKAAGRLYPCYEPPDELERRRKRQLARGLPPVYDRAALKLSEDERRRLEAEGRKPHWRFRLEGRDVAWDDLIRGPQHFQAGSLSDPVLVREDGTFLYTLTSVVDDGDLGISHVIRGEDHVANTAVQIELFEALGLEQPVWAHHNLLTAASGEGLSKRLGSLSLRALREDGYEPMAVASLATLIGTSEAVEPYADLDALARAFELDKVSRAPARFDPAELDGLNARLLRRLPYEAVAARLSALGIPAGREFWETVRDNCTKLEDAKRWWDLIAGAIAPAVAPENREFLRLARDLAPPEPWDETTWSAWTEALKTHSGRNGKALFRPLRRALTGLDSGPEMRTLLPLIGRDRSLARLS